MREGGEREGEGERGAWEGVRTHGEDRHCSAAGIEFRVYNPIDRCLLDFLGIVKDDVAVAFPQQMDRVSGPSPKWLVPIYRCTTCHETLSRAGRWWW